MFRGFRLGKAMGPRLSRSLFAISSKKQTRSTMRLQSIYDNLMNIQDIALVASNPLKFPEITECLKLMDGITAEDIGFDRYDHSILGRNKCVSILCNSSFHLAAFYIPAGSALPLHDHPSMTVISKVVFGDLIVRSFSVSEFSSSLVANNRQAVGMDVQATLVLESEKGPKDSSWLLTPSGICAVMFKYCFLHSYSR